MNCTNEVAQRNADITRKNGMTKRRLGHSRATQVRMEYLRLLIKQKYVQVEGLDTSKLLVNALDGENSSQQSNKN